MEFKRNEKVQVKIGNKIYNATVVGSIYRMFSEKEDYIEVYIHETQTVETANIKTIII